MTATAFLLEHWTLLTIPVISSLVGYTTNWLAVKMMMYPIEFHGTGPVGWQGVIPANANKMANLVVEHSLKRVLTQEELISRIEANELIDAMNDRLDPLVEDLVDDVMTQTSNYGIHVSHFFWSASPVWLKTKVYKEVRRSIPEVVEKIIEDLKGDVDELVDINEIIVEKLGNNKEMLVDVFYQSCKKEFRFIQNSGLYFGFPLGVPVMFIWHFFPVWWLLPLFGLSVGYITNLLALYLVQKPLNPKRIGPFVIQGSFIKRQKEVSAFYGELFATKLINAEVLVGEILKSQFAMAHIRDIILKEVNRAVEASQGSFKPITVLSMGPKEYEKIGQIITDITIREVRHPDKHSLAYMDRAMAIEPTVAERVGNLPPEEFYELLHPIIEEDEWKLIAVGAALGLVAGICQWLVLT